MQALYTSSSASQQEVRPIQTGCVLITEGEATLPVRIEDNSGIATVLQMLGLNFPPTAWEGQNQELT